MTIYLGDYREKLEHVRADLIFTSPPYNIGSKQERKDGYRRAGRYDPKSYGGIRDYPDSVPEAEYQQQQVRFLEWAAEHLNRDGVLVYNHKPRRNGHLIHPMEWVLKAHGLILMEEITWDRGSTHNHCMQMVWQQTERLYVFMKAGGKYLLRNDAGLSDVWRIKRARSNGHAAPFPEELARRVVLGWSNPGDLVCDPYSGSGTVAAVCAQLGRKFEGAEIVQRYHEMALARVAS